MSNEESKPDQVVYITFMANISEKTTSQLLYIISEQLKAGVKKLFFNISSNGGRVHEAISLYNFIRGIQNVEVRTHNFGNVGSSAIALFLAGHRRSCSQGASFLIHGVKQIFTSGAVLGEEGLDEARKSLRLDSKKIREIIIQNVIGNKARIQSKLKKLQIIRANEAKRLGLINEIKDSVIQPGHQSIVITNQA